MPVPIRELASSHYCVEVSGWDVSEGFFVEKCELEWNEQSGKCVAMRRTLPEGAHGLHSGAQETPLYTWPCPRSPDTPSCTPCRPDKDPERP